jgi:cupin fold WbuC family metalloprotein
MQIHELNLETSYVIDPVAPHMSANEIFFLKERYIGSPRKRHRFCFHQNPEVDLHDIVICYDHTSYIPPNKHVGKVESLLVLSGTLDFYLFNDAGHVYDYRRLSSPSSGNPFYLRVPPNSWHGLRAVGDTPCVIKETISGPYDRTTLHWAPFAPAESDGADAGFRWYEQISNECKTRGIVPPPDENFEKISDVIYRSSRQLVTVSLAQLQPIIDAANKSPLKRARLCCHAGPEDKLQEMFIALASGVDIEESMHLRKDESLTVISGQGTYLFPNEDGSARELVTLNPFSPEVESQGSFFVRINRYVPHKIRVDSDVLLIHEATSGPFVKADTDYRLKRVDL